MALIRVNHRPSRPQLALFGAVWVAVFAVLARRAYAHAHGPLGVAGTALGALAPVAGLFGWEGLRRLYVAACYAAFPCGWLVSHVVLAAVYYLVLTPTGFVLRLCGYDPLLRRCDRRATTYWRPRDPPPPPESYFRPS